MTIRQKRLIKNLGNSRSIKEAALKSGYSKNVAEHNQRELVQGLAVQAELAKDDEIAFNTHREAFKATKLITSPTEPDREWPDWTNRISNTKLHFQTRGWLKEDTNLSLNQNNVMIIESYGPEDPLTNRSSAVYEADTSRSETIKGT